MGQLRRAVVSIETNIVEGYALRTRPLFRRHIRIALGSAVETERLLAICAELGYVPHLRVAPLLRTADRTVALLYRLLESLVKP
jgi:four helix bundle protein